jgi:type II secretory pathway pseudopilin PulG
MKYFGNKRSAFTVIELTVVISVFVILFAILTPFVKMTKDNASKIQCANNVRKLSLGLHGYAADNNGVFPADLKTLYPNYVADARAFDCPATKTVGTPDDSDYKYTAGLTEASQAKSVIVEDNDRNHGKRGRNILRVNGAVEWQ